MFSDSDLFSSNMLAIESVKKDPINKREQFVENVMKAIRAKCVSQDQYVYLEALLRQAVDLPAKDT